MFFDEASRLGLRTVAEAFADRAYQPDGTLVSRRDPGAVLHNPDEVAARVMRMVRTGRVLAVDGTDIEVSVESVCVHGDSPGATHIAAAVWEQLSSNGIALRAFC